MIRPPKEQKQPISVVAWAKMSGFLVPKYKSNHNNDYWRRSEEFIREKKNEVALGLFFSSLEDLYWWTTNVLGAIYLGWTWIAARPRHRIGYNAAWCPLRWAVVGLWAFAIVVKISQVQIQTLIQKLYGALLFLLHSVTDFKARNRTATALTIRIVCC